MSNENSKTTGKSDGAEQTFVQPKGVTARPQQINMQRVQNVLLIWLDSNIDENNADCRNTLTQLRLTVNDINIFTDGEECFHFVDNITDTKICMIISGSLGQHIVPCIHNMSQVDSIFIFCDNKKYHEQWAEDWPKVRGVFTEISSVCKALKQAVQQCERNAISISFATTSHNDVSKKNLDQLDPIFMYSQILKEILLTIKFNDEHIKQYTDYCRNVLANNDRELQNVDKLQKEYHTKTPIWWYTWESFLYPMLNRALRLMDMNIIIKMGFFINDLHHHIEQLHSEQFSSGNNSNQSFTVYRGQGLSKADFDKMTKNQGGLMSFNNFLSTSKDHQVSLGFARRALSNMDMIGILFVMTINPVKSTTSFASIVDVGYFGDKEDEILFSMHTVFRIGEIISKDESQRLFQVNLTLTSDDDTDLHLLTDRVREETGPNAKGWHRLGLLLLKVGEPVKAQQVYEILLDQATGVDEKGVIYHQLGWTKDAQGEYNEAITFYEKALEIYKKTLSFTDLNLANCYNNIGMVYDKVGDYPRAISYYEEALKIQQQSPPSNHPDLTSSYNNIGLVCYHMGDYPKALLYYEKTLEIQKQSLPSNHPELGGSYNNIGLVYDSMGDYPKALSYYEKALEIRQQSLPSNHPNLVMSYGNIGNVYYNMNDYPKALLFHEKALEIQNQSLPSNHSSLGSIYNNIGNVCYAMGDYSKALSFHEKALEIKQQSLPWNHPDISTSYNNIGFVYFKMGNYSKACSCYERAVNIGQHLLPANHPHLQLFKRNLDKVKEKL